MNEDDLARRIVEQLDRNLAGLPASTVEKLYAARMAALAGHRGAATTRGTRAGASSQPWFFGQGLALRLALPVAIVVASITGLLLWQMSSQHEDELEASLLAGELPIHAYIDPGFETWLRNTAHTPSQ